MISSVNHEHLWIWEHEGGTVFCVTPPIFLTKPQFRSSQRNSSSLYFRGEKKKIKVKYLHERVGQKLHYRRIFHAKWSSRNILALSTFGEKMPSTQSHSRKNFKWTKVATFYAPARPVFSSLMSKKLAPKRKCNKAKHNEKCQSGRLHDRIHPTKGNLTGNLPDWIALPQFQMASEWLKYVSTTGRIAMQITKGRERNEWVAKKNCNEKKSRFLQNLYSKGLLENVMQMHWVQLRGTACLVLCSSTKMQKCKLRAVNQSYLLWGKIKLLIFPGEILVGFCLHDL